MGETELAGGIMWPALGGKQVGREDALMEDKPGKEPGFGLRKSPPDFRWLKLREGSLELNRVGRGRGVASVLRP